MPTKPKDSDGRAAPKPKTAPKPRRKAEPPSEPQPVVKITNEGENNVNVVATASKSIAANIRIIFQGNWKPFAAVLFVVAVLLGTILWYVIPHAAKSMTGQFNVAVAEFLVQDVNGKPIRGEDGSLLAAYIVGQIGTQFTEIELKKTIPYEIWGPKETGSITGDTAEERSLAAVALAEKIHAHVLIYGVIISDGKKSRFMPEFYVNHASFQDASEITGEHEIGSQVRLDLPFVDSIQSIENNGLAGRVNAMDLITIGLAYYSVDDYKNAARYLEQAAAEERWLEASGKEVAYLLIGNTYIRWASKDDDSQYLTAAAKNYDEALRINPDYGRGLVGQANVLYLEAVLDDTQIDLVKLDQADELLTQALSLEGQPESANIPAKAHFQRGQIYLARYGAKIPVPSGEADWIAQAKDEFTFVVAEYEAGDTSLESLASHTYYRLGLCAFYRNSKNPSQAIALIEKAISMSSLFYQAEYTAGLGSLYKYLGEKENAIQAYEDAIAIAESNGDAKSAQKYQQSLDELMQP